MNLEELAGVFKLLQVLFQRGDIDTVKKITLILRELYPEEMSEIYKALKAIVAPS